ncbi:hypothetical protein EYZ11_001269 [Aspergillus tanneri]|uniref:Uncharacterized protein n=1 Tax=Aspergillus tanneri TaxID=1220188 RepID=A0A4V3UQI5_9EURO|nr:uncharacterized protein ATNIH1004_007143 [Aspergillus tanneri]KAA8645724.1 hypothetical protein ATNIH1004_007143 [Aspergillus tanneri]THC99270.1 hypothetical protein EYZ11_001269 [Aspergillus tanneri]
MTPNTGRASGDVNSDDYVAQVLAREARNNSLKYSTQGLGAYLPKRCATKQRTTPKGVDIIDNLRQTIEIHDEKGKMIALKDTVRTEGDIEAVQHQRTENVPHETTDTRKESSSFLTPTPQDGGESDPLEDLVGPLPPKEDGFGSSPPIRSRGRGAYKPNSSNIDAHFAPDYDPSLDVQLEEAGPSTKNTSFRRPVSGLMTEDDDWELALEALHDRARWRQKGEERLREAGFNDSFVERWKSNTTSATAHDSEGRLEDVKWSKKGEGREWDRGKFVDKEGHIDVKASW